MQIGHDGKVTIADTNYLTFKKAAEVLDVRTRTSDYWAKTHGNAPPRIKNRAALALPWKGILRMDRRSEKLSGTKTGAS